MTAERDHSLVKSARCGWVVVGGFVLPSVKVFYHQVNSRFVGVFVFFFHLCLKYFTDLSCVKNDSEEPLTTVNNKMVQQQ